MKQAEEETSRSSVESRGGDDFTGGYGVKDSLWELPREGMRRASLHEGVRLVPRRRRKLSSTETQ
jgi:hypothetical protein